MPLKIVDLLTENFTGFTNSKYNQIMKIRKIFVVLMLGAMSLQAQAQTDKIDFLPAGHCMMRTAATGRYLMIPVQESAQVSNVRVVVDNRLEENIDIRLAADRVDHYVPLDLSRFDGQPVLLDIRVPAGGDARKLVCWESMKYADTVSIPDEQFRPEYHHAPAWGWMNDPNGMFYKDGVWHLCYQWNPYGSQWGNLAWGHSTSTDLVNWKDEGRALAPDALGLIFSGSSVVDKDNTAGFGKDAVVAFYTTADKSQTQSMAYSTDGGLTFKKYEGNPVIVADVPDFRDPHVFRHEPTDKWIMILAAGQEMRIYSSADLKAWTYESSFGREYGAHGGVWECPDLFELPVEGTDEKKWVLLCNINPGGPFGGSATQYFTGSFDGHKFTCDTEPGVTKWMDYGKDHYATVTFDNAPNDRRVAIAWMNNWQYAPLTPTMEFKSANSIARDLFLFRDGGNDYLGSKPSKEIEAARGKTAMSETFTLGEKTVDRLFDAPRGAYEINMDIDVADGSTVSLTLANGRGERVAVVYDDATRTLTFDRRFSGDKSFSESFPAVTTAPVYGRLSSLRIFVDNCSVELFADNGRSVMTNLVFPSEPYNSLSMKSDKKTEVKKMEVFGLK